jgi:hypothetical protein
MARRSHQKGQQVEHLRFDRHDAFAAAQFAPVRVQRIAFKEILQGGRSPHRAKPSS